MSEARYRIDSANVVHETIDGEAIIIDLASGNYFSLSGCGPQVWEMLAAGAGEAEIAAALETRFEAEPGAIGEAVSSLLGELRESRLIEADGEAPSAREATPNGATRSAFDPPMFERYTDLKDYFLLDPIHEVSEAGWPKPAA